ncbi:VOC family protein [Pendulispora rubella]|uniref:VOC family protein n=1 Tax=Pendulispora rubella TaxID=2741070 RepID=A0ABZ2KVA5_9BACT
MKITSYYPVVLTDDVAKTATFYVTHFGFEPLFESAWYVHLRSTFAANVNLGIVQYDHETVPPEGRVKSALLLNFEVDDPDEVYARVEQAGLPILRTLRDEPFGQRHFITADPNGVMIDVIKPIPPSAEFAAQYADEALPR